MQDTVPNTTMRMSKKGKACGEGCNCMKCANTNINQTTTKIDIDASIEETLQEDPPHNINVKMEWMFGEGGEEVEHECDEESDIDQN